MMTVTPMTAHGTGAEVHGVDLTRPVDAATRAVLNAAFVKHHVLVVRDQTFDPAQFYTAAQVFGEIMPHHGRDEVHVPGHPDMFFVSNQSTIRGTTTRILAGGSFHTDHSNHTVPPKATTLFPVSLPDSGGDTQFVNMHAAYDDLTRAMKRKIVGLRSIQVYLSKYSPRPLRGLSDDAKKEMPPPSLHPLVRVHPENGRKALYLNPVRMEGIVGMPDEEALALIAELMQHAIQQKYEYRHKWRQGDMVIWDNRSVIHQANGDYDMNQLRYLYRLMLKGEPLIPVPPEDADAIAEVETAH